MNILLTGATGNLGMNALPELLRQGHQVRCFVRRPKALEHTVRNSGGKIELVQGDMQRPADLAKAVEDTDVIIHLAYMIPPGSEDHPDLARLINVDGTRQLLEAASSQFRPPRFFFASSFDVFGHTQHQPPPRKVTDPVQASDHYTTHKIACEEMVRTSGLQWTIFRFADVPPLGLRQPHPIMFRIPLSTRFEVIHPYDAGLAIANGIDSSEVWGRTLLIGGGPGCQILYRDYLWRMLEMMGIGMLPERAFGSDPYSTDWLDTGESQCLLHYQRYTFDDIIEHLTRIVGYKRLLTALMRPAARWWILRMSPYYKA
jgi:nucleoside-diphosphate-sugar epimerase